MFNPSSDLTAIQSVLINDAILLSLLNLTGKSQADIAKKIIKRNCWDDLVTNEKRLCVYFRPSRKLLNLKFNEEVIEIDCHVPSSLDHIAYQIQERIFILLNEKMVNNRYIYFNGQLGELPTMPGFFSCGSKYIFKRKI